MKQVAPRTIFGLFDPNRLKLTFSRFSNATEQYNGIFEGKTKCYISTVKQSSLYSKNKHIQYTYKIKNDKGKLVNAILKLVGNTAEKDVQKKQNLSLHISFNKLLFFLPLRMAMMVFRFLVPYIYTQIIYRGVIKLMVVVVFSELHHFGKEEHSHSNSD